MMIYSSTHFKQAEFACKCGCGFGTAEKDIAEDLVIALEKLRTAVGVPFKLDSAARCTKHNADVGGKPRSAHVAGVKGQCTPKYEGQSRAVDISVDGWAPGLPLLLAQLAVDMGLRVGVAQTFIHLDVETSKYYPLRHWAYRGRQVSSGD